VLLSAAKGLLSCGPIGMEWPPHWAALLAGGLPFQILHLPQVLLLWPWLCWECLWVTTQRHSLCLWKGAI